MDYQRKLPRSLSRSKDEPAPVRMSPEWTAEINARIQDIESGRVALVSQEEVDAGLERLLGRRLRRRGPHDKG